MIISLITHQYIVSEEKCYGPQPDCTPNPQYKLVGGPTWCGKSWADMSERCADECPNGLDEECPGGEVCYSGSPCQFEEVEVIPPDPDMLWCGASYGDLVENCPRRCPDGECPDGMECFSMQAEEKPCAEEGVGVKKPVDPANLWCGSSFIHLLEK